MCCYTAGFQYNTSVLKERRRKKSDVCRDYARPRKFSFIKLGEIKK